MEKCVVVIRLRARYLSAEPVVLLNVVYLYIIKMVKIPLLISSFQSSVVFHIETSQFNRFLYEMQYRTEMC